MIIYHVQIEGCAETRPSLITFSKELADKRYKELSEANINCSLYPINQDSDDPVIFDDDFYY